MTRRSPAVRSRERLPRHISPRQYEAILRNDLHAFTQRAFAELNPARSFKDNWHLEVLADRLTRVLRGDTKRLIINMPPRYLKSISTSVALPAFALGHDPAKRIISVSYAQDLADKLSIDARTVMSSEWYRRLFPGTRLSRTPNTKAEFRTTEGGFRLATSTGGALTGRGADLIIVDDPIKPDDALSEARRNTCNEWCSGTLQTRLDDKTDGAIIVVMHRLHEDDLSGYVQQSGEWEVLSLPAIAVEQETFSYRTLFGPQTHVRQEGEVLHPGVETREQIEAMRANMGSYHFLGQYQQTPTPREGSIVKIDWFRRYAEADRPARFDQILCSWDTGTKATELSDYSVCTVWGVANKHKYLLHVVRRKMEYPELKQMVRQVATAHSANVILIEDKAAGTQLIQELRNEGVHGVHAYTPTNAKEMRMHAQCATIESGLVYLPEKAPWLDDYLHELATFPGSKHDDQVDSTSQALEFLAIGKRTTGLLEFYRQRYEEDLRQGRIAPDPDYPLRR